MKQTGYYLETNWCCSETCLEKVILQQLEKQTRPHDNSFQALLKIKLGHILLENGVISREHLEQAIAEQQKGEPERLGHHLMALDFVKEHDITLALGRQFGLPVIKPTNLKINSAVRPMVPIQIVKSSNFFPLDYDSANNRLVLVTFDPSDISTMINLRTILDCEVTIYLSDESVVRQMIDRYCQEAVGSPDPNGGEASEPVFGNPDSLAASIVQRAKEIKARSLNIAHFNHLIWTRFFVGTEPVDWIVGTTG